MADLLFELGVEEMPAAVVRPTLAQLKDGLTERLTAAGVVYSTVEAAATNRRLMLYVQRIGERTEIKQETVLGPAKKIALNEMGQPTMALQKFMELHGVRLGDILEIETPKGVYLGVVKTTGGDETADILKRIVPEVLAALTFPKTMVWNESRVPFVRPVKTILLLLGNKPVDVEFAGVKSGRHTQGHLLLSTEMLEIGSYKEYIEQLSRNFILIHEEERREKILAEVRDIEEDIGGTVQIPSDMLDYFVFTNEYPVVFSGRFDKRYLGLPAEIIGAFMTHEKKLLPVHDAAGRLLDQFVGVANIPDENKKVSQGNEKVVQATFEDAQFFWETDRKEDFLALRQGLKNVMFQRELGTYWDKTERLAGLVDFLVRETGHTDLRQVLQKAAFCCKNDLLTRMVREFPSLQGVMGGLYLKQAGEEERVWRSVYDHYLPRGLADEKLPNLEAGMLSAADRIDNLAGFFSKGIKVSGSKDPYGIRRDANAVLKILVDFELDVDLGAMLRLAAIPFARDDAHLSQVCQGLREFLRGRLEAYLKDVLGYRYDVVNAVMAPLREIRALKAAKRAAAVSEMAHSDSIAVLVALHKRLKNIIKKAEHASLSEGLLEQPEERLLFEVLRETKTRTDGLLLKDEYLAAGSQILEMKPVIDGFFDKVLVMAEDASLRRNRIALLQRIEEMLSALADFSLIV